MAGSANCPVCLKAEHVRKILWGMPSGDKDLEKFYIGGCLVEENPAKYICIACEYEFGARQQSRFIMDSLQGVTITCGVCKKEFEPSNSSADHACE